MAHIVYDGKFYSLKDESVQEVREAIKTIFREDGNGELVLTGSDGDKAYLFISRGVNIAVNEWDTPFA